MFYEIRTEHAQSGRGAELAAYLDASVIPLHQELGMQVVGSFTVADDEDAFVWIRRFDDDAERERVLDAVHQDPRCDVLIETLSTLAGAKATTVRLEPTGQSGLQ